MNDLHCPQSFIKSNALLIVYCPSQWCCLHLYSLSSIVLVCVLFVSPLNLVCSALCGIQSIVILLKYALCILHHKRNQLIKELHERFRHIKFQYSFVHLDISLASLQVRCYSEAILTTRVLPSLMKNFQVGYFYSSNPPFGATFYNDYVLKISFDLNNI